MDFYKEFYSDTIYKIQYSDKCSLDIVCDTFDCKEYDLSNEPRPACNNELC